MGPACPAVAEGTGCVPCGVPLLGGGAECSPWAYVELPAFLWHTPGTAGPGSWASFQAQARFPLLCSGTPGSLILDGTASAWGMSAPAD